MRTEGLVMAFGRFVAIDHLGFVASYGEIRGVIGPNGAVKTTLLDVLTGKSRPQEGSVLLDGALDITKLSEVQLALAGIGRKFQKPSVFEALTVWENLDLALRLHRRSLLREIVASRHSKRRRSPACSTRSASAACQGAWPARCRTGRSNGWRSAWCWRRSRSCCCSTSRSPG